MASEQLLEINTLALLISVVCTYFVSGYFAKKAQGIAEKQHFAWIFIISIVIGLILKMPLFLLIATGLFGMVVYMFKMANY